VCGKRWLGWTVFNEALEQWHDNPSLIQTASKFLLQHVKDCDNGSGLALDITHPPIKLVSPVGCTRVLEPLNDSIRHERKGCFSNLDVGISCGSSVLVSRPDA
jgi:hypothetical protein